MSEIKEKVQAFIHKYLEVTEAAESVIADYALQTWQPLGNSLKYLQFIGEPGTGKTRAGEVMASICSNPLKSSDFAHPSVSFIRLLDDQHPCTFIIDDMQTHTHKGEFATILNAGSSSTKRIATTTNDGTRIFDCFGHKVLLCRSEFKDPAIQSQCISIWLHPLTRNDIPVVLDETFEADSLDITRSLLDWRLT